MIDSVFIGYLGPFAPDAALGPAVYDFDGNLLLGEARHAGSGARYLLLFRKHDYITTVSPVHSVYLGAWSQAHRPRTIRYLQIQRRTRVRELPVYQTQDALLICGGFL